MTFVARIGLFFFVEKMIVSASYLLDIWFLTGTLSTGESNVWLNPVCLIKFESRKSTNTFVE